MKNLILFLIFFLLGITELYSQNTMVEFDTINWEIEKNTKITEFAGRKVLTGTAYLKGVEFLLAT